MRIVFMGTPQFALPSLNALFYSEHEIIAVVTQPDRPKGRHLNTTFSPIKEMALSYKIPVYQPRTPNDEDFKKKVIELVPDVIVVVAFGQLIPSWMLNLPRYGCVNVHASLLPKYRGAAPIQRAIMDGCIKTGVTTMLMDIGLDTGDILLQTKVSVSDEETVGELYDKLANVSPGLLLKTLKGLGLGTITPTKQNDAEASFAAKIEKKDIKIDWSNPVEKIRNIIRALSPKPGAYSTINGRRLKIFKAKEISKNILLPPGTVDKVKKSLGFTVSCLDGALLILQVQPEGKMIMTADEFCRGYNLREGDKFE